MKKKNDLFFWGSIIFILIAIIVWAVYSNNAPSKLTGFAQCLNDKGAKFYGAFWCSHCQNQKRVFGSAAQFLPYIECSTPDGRGILPVCAEAKITGYPTWVFADGNRLEGETSLKDLGEKTGCSLPE